MPKPKAKQPGRYIPEWPEFEAIAARLSRQGGGVTVRAGSVVRAVLRAFLALKPESQEKAIKTGFLALQKKD